MHSGAVAATSSVFDRLVNGDMCEAQTRSAELQDVDPATFMRFLEYAYRHDYTDPAWAMNTSSNLNGVNGQDVLVVRPDDEELIVPDDDATQGAAQGALSTASFEGTWTNSRSAPSGFGAVPSTFALPPVNKKFIKYKDHQAGLRAAFAEREYPIPSYHGLTPSRGVGNLESTSMSLPNFAPIFLAHARLYTLADMRLVYPLRDLALHKLHKVLVDFKLHSGRLGDVIELARYAYEHGEDRSENGKVDALRDMVVNYITCEMKGLGKHAGFRDLMDGGGELAGDFWDIVSQELP